MTAVVTSSPKEASVTVERRDHLDHTVQPALEDLARLPEDSPERERLRDSVIEQALPLADRLAHRFEHRGEPLDDLVQVARLGLVKVVDNYNVDRGSGFTRFAVPSILGELKRHFRDKGWMIRVPRQLQETRLAINTASRELTQRLGREPTVADIAEHLAIPTEQVRAGMDCVGAYDAVSLHSPAHRESDDELADSIGGPDRGMDAVDARMTLHPLVGRLRERERRILAMRFAEDLTQSQIAERVDLSQMHVSRLLRQTLAKLREGLTA